MLKNKKGIALNQAFGAVLALVLVAILVIVALLLFNSLGATFTNLQQIGEINETQNLTDAATSMDQSVAGNSTLCNYAGFAVSVITINVSGEATVLPTANYTLGEKGTVTLTTLTAAGTFNGTNMNISYSANDGGPSCVATNVMIAQFATYPALIGLVGTIIFLGIVIGVLVASFVFGGRGDRV